MMKWKLMRRTNMTRRRMKSQKMKICHLYNEPSRIDLAHRLFPTKKISSQNQTRTTNYLPPLQSTMPPPTTLYSTSSRSAKRPDETNYQITIKSITTINTIYFSWPIISLSPLEHTTNKTSQIQSCQNEVVKTYDMYITAGMAFWGGYQWCI